MIYTFKNYLKAKSYDIPLPYFDDIPISFHCLYDVSLVPSVYFAKKSHRE